MRRLTPYLLLAVLALGTGLGIGLGLSQAQGSPSRLSTGLPIRPQVTTTTQPSLPSSTTTSVPPGAPPCVAASLSLQGGRQGGGFQTAAGVVIFTNTGASPCALSGTPSVALVDQTGVVLNVQDKVPQSPVRPLLIEPASTGYMTVYWFNWCGPAPGPLQVSVSLPSGAGTVAGDFNEPSVVPGRMDPSRPSTLQVVNAYFSN